MDANTNSSQEFLFDFATFEALLRGVRGYDDPAMQALVKDRCGIDFQRPKRHYSAEVFQKLVEVVRETYFAEMAQPVALVAIGRALARGYAKTLVGRVMAAPVKTVTTERALQQMVRMFNTGQASGQRDLVKLDEQHYVVRFRNDLFYPGITEGIVKFYLESLNINEVQVDIKLFSANDYDVDLKW